jgi:hypothetical protein
MKYAHRLMMQPLEDRAMLSVFQAEVTPVDFNEDAATVVIRVAPTKSAAASSASATLAPTVRVSTRAAAATPAPSNARVPDVDVMYVSTNDAVINYGFGFSEHHVGDPR